MCQCKNIKIGTHKANVPVPAPSWSSREYLSIDGCILEEILWLWYDGIITTGCCCGHNIHDGYIGVEDEFIQEMKDRGYEVYPNHLYPEREDSFYPKSIERIK